MVLGIAHGARKVSKGRFRQHEYSCLETNGRCPGSTGCGDGGE